jgi:hypothetical protein
MKKHLSILVLSLLLFGNAIAGKQDMISALKGIPGVADALWNDNISLWISMSNPNGGSNFSVNKGYSIVFWDPYVPKQITKFRCY